MNECVENTESSKLPFEDTNADSAAKKCAKTDSQCSNVAADTSVTVSATSTTVITATSTATASDTLLPAEALWNQFLKNISQQSRSSQCSKYPNPEVPEFYPRRLANVARAPGAPAAAAAATKSSAGTSHRSDASTNLRYVNKSELIKRYSADVTELTSSQSADSADPMQTAARTQYYWTFHDVSSEYIPSCVNFDADAAAPPKSAAEAAVEFADVGAKGAVAKSTSASAGTTAADLLTELNTKNQQLAHLNHVVKALLEEIWKINELSTRHKSGEQWKSDMTFAANEFLKPIAELGFHCDDCCARLKDFVTRVTKQLEHKMAKQQVQYRNQFVDTILTVVENSLRTLTQLTAGEDFKSRLLKHNVHTQTHFADAAAALNSNAGGRLSSRAEAARRNKLQITKVYRNRNFYKCYNDQEMGQEQWLPNARHESTNGGGRSMRFSAPSKSYAFQSAQQTFGDAAAQNPVNPIQLIHQKYKNLNCRLEGIPDKNLVKFSYIVNGREYSAIASTKKEAQYHCAWHVLGATRQE